MIIHLFNKILYKKIVKAYKKAFFKKELPGNKELYSCIYGNILRTIIKILKLRYYLIFTDNGKLISISSIYFDCVLLLNIFLISFLIYFH